MVVLKRTGPGLLLFTAPNLSNIEYSKLVVPSIIRLNFHHLDCVTNHKVISVMSLTVSLRTHK
jgi:hypothetical protein